MCVAVRPDFAMVRGEGSWLWDDCGRRYLDFIQGWAVNCLGHANEVIVRALCAQAAQLINPGPAFHNAPAARLARRLADASQLDRVFFANSGAEANEGAIKLARKWGTVNRKGAHRIITLRNGFHGRTLATMSASGKAGWESLFEPKVPGFIKVPINDLNAVRAVLDDSVIAVMLEPIQGEGGVIPASDGYLRGLRELTAEAGVLLILDEVQTGMGRTGKLFAHQWAGVLPDIMTLGKGIGGGVPLAALVARQAVCCFEPGDQGGTYNGNPLMAAVGCAVFDAILGKGFLENILARSAELEIGLKALATKLGFGEVRGRGLLLALDFGVPIATAVAERALAAGLLLNAPKPSTLRFMPALNVSSDEIALMLELLAGAVTAQLSLR